MLPNVVAATALVEILATIFLTAFIVLISLSYGYYLGAIRNSPPPNE